MESTDRCGDDSPPAFLRWVGGKTWLVPRMTELFGRLNFNKYHEPFLGGGSVFFACASNQPAFLSDKSESLIETYLAVRDDCDGVIKFMRTFENTEQDYYRVRAENYTTATQRAAQFIYLNQTSFNGIYRVNLKGIYNVPYGHRKKLFLDEPLLRRASAALSTASLKAADFADTLENVRAGDLVFIDPPYTVSHNNNGFIKYNQSLFSLDDQYRLAEFIEQVRIKGASYILTNAAHETIDLIFGSSDRKLEVKRASLIGGKKAQRGAVAEYVFTNLRTQ